MGMIHIIQLTTIYLVFQNITAQRPRLLFVCIFENKIKKIYVIIFEDILILVIEIETK